MLASIRWLVTRLAVVRWLFKALGGLGLLVPLALLLRFVGLPVLAVLGVLAFPVLLLLFLFGLPVFLVLLAGGAIMGLLGVLLTLGLVALKFVLLVVVPVWLVWSLASWTFRWARDGEKGSGSPPPEPPPPPAPPTAAPPPPSSPPEGGIAD